MYECNNYSELAMELLQSYTKPSARTSNTLLAVAMP